MSEPVVIAADRVTRMFGNIRALDGISFQVKKGEVFGFLGHNGAGKTTTVRLLNGLLKPTEGTIRVWDLSPVAEGPALRAKTGVLPETSSLDERLTARENLRFYADLYRVPEDKVQGRIDELLSQFGLSDRGGDYVQEYSKGMKQRLSLARTILHSPPILFLDEPTAGLDPVSARQVQEMIMGLSQEGHTVFLCTHNLQEAQRLCHRVAVLRHGALIAVGTPEELSEKTQRQALLEVEIAPGDSGRLARYLEKQDVTFQMGKEGAEFRIQGLPREAIPVFVRNLTQEKINLYRIDPVAPTLEDIYFALHEDWEEMG